MTSVVACLIGIAFGAVGMLIFIVLLLTEE